MTDPGAEIRHDGQDKADIELSRFADQLTAGADRLRDIMRRLASTVGEDRSGVGAVIAGVLETGTEVADRVLRDSARLVAEADLAPDLSVDEPTTEGAGG
jgi:hypothetical protein